MLRPPLPSGLRVSLPFPFPCPVGPGYLFGVFCGVCCVSGPAGRLLTCLYYRPVWPIGQYDLANS